LRARARKNVVCVVARRHPSRGAAGGGFPFKHPFEFTGAGKEEGEAEPGGDGVKAAVIKPRT